MTDEQRQAIVELRGQNVGYGTIAKQLDMTSKRVQKFCRYHKDKGLMGTKAEGCQLKTRVCDQCGGEYVHTKEYKDLHICPVCKSHNTELKEKRRAEKEQSAPLRICIFPGCDKEFKPRSDRQKCCCRKHGHDLLQMQYKAERDNKKPKPILIKCSICGKEFYPHDKQQKCCSKECRNHMRYLREKQAGKRDTENTRVKCYTYICKQCGKEYHPKEKKRDAYCSRECFYEHIDQRHKGVVAGRKQQRVEILATQKYLTQLRNDIINAMNKELKTKTYICDICGKAFESDRKQRYCSDECKKVNQRAYQNAYKEIKRRKAYKNGAVDNSISLNKLAKRDKNHCHICGDKCDWNNFITIGSTFIALDNYPSIDHVIPISKGGTHTWGNVKLAHRCCNTIKRNNLVYEGRDGQIVLSL